MALQSINPTIGADLTGSTVTLSSKDGRLTFRNVKVTGERLDILADPSSKGVADPSCRDLGFEFTAQKGYAVQTKGTLIVVKCIKIFKQYPWLKDGVYTLKFDKFAKIWMAQDA